jgi:hypothetical protein
MGYDENTPGENLGRALRNVTDAFIGLIRELTSPNAATGLSTLDSIAQSLNSIASGINAITNAVDKGRSWWGSSTIPIQFSPGGINAPRTGRAVGGSVSAGMAYTVGEMGKEVFVPNTSGQIIPNNKLGGNITVNLNGIIDGESARRTIEKLLQDSARRTGAINLAGALL